MGLGFVALVVATVILWYQSIDSFGLLEKSISYSIFGDSNIYTFVIHTVACRWAVVFALFGTIMGILMLMDKNESLGFRKFGNYIGYALFVIMLLSLL